jgi:hypothetical protein
MTSSRVSSTRAYGTGDGSWGLALHQRDRRSGHKPSRAVPVKSEHAGFAVASASNGRQDVRELTAGRFPHDDHLECHEHRPVGDGVLPGMRANASGHPASRESGAACTERDAGAGDERGTRVRRLGTAAGLPVPRR